GKWFINLPFHATRSRLIALAGWSFRSLYGASSGSGPGRSSGSPWKETILSSPRSRIAMRSWSAMESWWPPEPWLGMPPITVKSARSANASWVDGESGARHVGDRRRARRSPPGTRAGCALARGEGESDARRRDARARRDVVNTNGDAPGSAHHRRAGGCDGAARAGTRSPAAALSHDIPRGNPALRGAWVAQRRGV